MSSPDTNRVIDTIETAIATHVSPATDHALVKSDQVIVEDDMGTLVGGRYFFSEITESIVSTGRRSIAGVGRISITWYTDIILSPADTQREQIVVKQLLADTLEDRAKVDELAIRYSGMAIAQIGSWLRMTAVFDVEGY